MAELNRLFWTPDDILREPVRKVLLDVSEDIKDDVSELAGSDVVFERIMFVGSLAGVNYDNESDVDLHFLVDLGALNDRERKFLKGFFDYYTRNFNQKDFSLLGHPIEIYIQDTMEGFVSPGVYDIESEEWLQGPDKELIEITRDERREAESFLRRIKSLKSSFDAGNDVGDEAWRLFDSIKEYRQKGKASPAGFLKSPENIVFKLMRRNGGLDMITGIMKDSRQRSMNIGEE